MPRRLRPTLTGLSLGAALLLGAALQPAATLVTAPARAQNQSQSQPPKAATAQPVLTVEEARAAANRILDAVKSGDANARYAQFSKELREMTSPAMVQATMRTQPKVLSYQVLSVRSGLSTSTVEAELTTSAGARVIFIVLNGKGQIMRYYVDRTDDPTSKVAEQFVRALSTGNFITAHSFLSPDFQQDITPQALQAKWLNLQRITGLFQQVGRVVEAESTPDSHLVLVSVQFNRLSDNLFVILDANNRVTGVDFPSEPKGPKPVR
ncbi:MAG: DUF3887 domain-containing protein [Vulcanococcus sp.]